MYGTWGRGPMGAGVVGEGGANGEAIAEDKRDL